MLIRLFITTMLFISMQGCVENVVSNFADMDEVANERAVERGILPDFLPNTTKDITSNVNLDVNHAKGRFYIPENNSDSFFNKLQREHSLDEGNLRGYSHKGWYFWHGANNVVFYSNKKYKAEKSQLQ